LGVSLTRVEGVAFDKTNTRRAAVGATASGALGVQLEFFTKPNSAKARLFVRDNGAGKTQLCVQFNTGAVQVLATQP